MKQRSSFSITTSILETVYEAGEKGITSTQIMQRVMLNYKRSIRYCFSTIESQLLVYNPRTHTFHITERGRQVLDKSRQLASYVAPLGDMLNRYRFSFSYEQYV